MKSALVNSSICPGVQVGMGSEFIKNGFRGQWIPSGGPFFLLFSTTSETGFDPVGEMWDPLL